MTKLRDKHSPQLEQYQKCSAFPLCRAVFFVACEYEGHDFVNWLRLPHRKKYIGFLQKVMCSKINKERLEGRVMLGGTGKVVEIDEMFVCARKYGRGRPMAKEGTWVLGLTEDDEVSHSIENENFLELLRKREDKREEAARQRQERRKRHKNSKNAVRAPCPIPNAPAPVSSPLVLFPSVLHPSHESLVLFQSVLLKSPMGHLPFHELPDALRPNLWHF